MSCGVGHRYSLDPALLWLQRGPAATAPIGPLALEPSYASSAALERPKTNKQKNPTMRYHSISTRMARIRKMVNESVGVRMWRNWKFGIYCW